MVFSASQVNLVVVQKFKLLILHHQKDAVHQEHASKQIQNVSRKDILADLNVIQMKILKALIVIQVIVAAEQKPLQQIQELIIGGGFSFL